MNRPVSISDAKREDILQGAFEEFRENGFLGARMDSISKRAAASKRTVYRYFDSKEQLFNTLIRQLWTTIAARMSVTYKPGVDIKEQLTEMGRAQAALFLSPDIMATSKMLMSELIRDPAIVAGIQNEIDYTASFEQLLKEAGADKVLIIEDARQAAEVFISLLKGMAFWPYMLGSPLVEADEMEVMIERTVGIMLSYYGPSSRE